MNPSYKEQIWLVQSCSLQLSFSVLENTVKYLRKQDVKVAILKYKTLAFYEMHLNMFMTK